MQAAERYYDAYILDSGGLNWQGKPCPKWADLPPAIREHWEAVATLVVNERLGPVDTWDADCARRRDPAPMTDGAPEGTRWVWCHKRAQGCPDRWEPIDMEVADITEALQGRIATVAACSGHGTAASSVSLADGRVLIVIPAVQEAG